jgi:hypothetical protein
MGDMRKACRIKRFSDINMTCGEYVLRVVVGTDLGLGPVMDFGINGVDHMDCSTSELILLLYPLLCILFTVCINRMHIAEIMALCSPPCLKFRTAGWILMKSD